MRHKPVSYVADKITLHWAKIFFCLSFGFLLGTLYLVLDFDEGWGIGKSDARSFRDNVIVESVVGGLFLFAPIFIGVKLGKRSREIVFYSNIRKVIDKIKSLREAETITQQTARDLVMEISNAMGREILEESWWRFEYEIPSIVVEEKKCGICGLDAQLTVEPKKGKCSNCKLNCFVWEEKK